MTTYIGIDISKAVFDAATIDQKQSTQFKNTLQGYNQLLIWLSNFDQPHVGMEATGKYFLGLALFLNERGIPVYVINPVRIKRYTESLLRRVKTDSEDAKVIADFCTNQFLKAWQPDSEVIAQLQEWYKLQSLLTQQKVQLNNQLKSSLNAQVQDFQRDQLNQLDEQIKRVEAQIKKCLNTDAELTKQVQLLQSINGVGEKTAIQLVTFIKDIKRFDKAKQLASFAGLTPRIRRSGTSVNSSTLSKTGSADLRKSLYMPALCAIKFNPVLKDFSDNLKARGVQGKKRVVAVMRKLIHIVFAILKSGKPFDAGYKNHA